MNIDLVPCKVVLICLYDAHVDRTVKRALEALTVMEINTLLWLFIVDSV